MGTSSERVFNGSGKGYLPAGTIGNRTHILSERLKAGTEFKRLKKGHRPAPMPPTWTHILSYKPRMPPFFEGSNPQRPFSIIKKGPRWDPSLKLNWRRAGDSNPRCPFGAYSLSRRAPSASRAALRNSRNIIPYSAPTVQEKKCKSSEFSRRYAATPRPSYCKDLLSTLKSSLPRACHI